MSSDLAFVDRGTGPAVVFQHGLGGNEAQVAEVFPDADGRWRRLTLECRGQGASPPDALKRYTIRLFAEDVLRLADARQVERFAAGGISMGAAIALHLAVHHPGRVTALILARPAWLFDAAPPNMAPFVEVARLLARAAPGNLSSLRGFFTRPNPQTVAALLGGIAADGPGVTREQVAALTLPTLVIGQRIDQVHPLTYAETLAATIPGAALVEVTPRSTDAARYLAEFRAALRPFLAAL
jgi:pimeloyl-ACP methyl ester carboxylesterase